jgi:hypothetical protein
MKKLWSLLPLVIILLIASQYRAIIDWYNLRSFQPSSEIVAIAEDTTMTPTGKRYFYLARPQLDSKTTFNQHCPTGELTQVLGCYNRNRIYILDVDRVELEKVEDVTGAHEMLHAAYDRLSSGDRLKVDDEIESFYATVTDAKLRELVAQYDKAEPGERLNELHSILPTQVEALSPALEEYYKKYFTNRAAIVASYRQYEGVFDSLQSRYDSLKSEITSLKTRIDNAKTEYEEASAEADKLTSQITSLRNQGKIEESNQLVAAQNAAVARVNSLAAQIQSLVITYNADVEEINRLALEQNELVQSLNSNQLAPAR